MHESHPILTYPYEINMLAYYLPLSHTQKDHPGKGVKPLRTDNKQSKTRKGNFKVIVKG